MNKSILAPVTIFAVMLAAVVTASPQDETVKVSKVAYADRAAAYTLARSY